MDKNYYVIAIESLDYLTVKELKILLKRNHVPYSWLSKKSEYIYILKSLKPREKFYIVDENSLSKRTQYKLDSVVTKRMFYSPDKDSTTIKNWFRSHGDHRVYFNLIGGRDKEMIYFIKKCYTFVSFDNFDKLSNGDMRAALLDMGKRLNSDNKKELLNEMSDRSYELNKYMVQVYGTVEQREYLKKYAVKPKFEEE